MINIDQLINEYLNNEISALYFKQELIKIMYGFYGKIDDIGKSILLKKIILKLKKTDFLISFLPQLMNYHDKFIDKDFFYKVLIETDFVSFIIKKYKKMQYLLNDDELSQEKISIIDNVMMTIDKLKNISDKNITRSKDGKSYAHTKTRKKLMNISLEYNKLIKIIARKDGFVGIYSYDGIRYHERKIIGNDSYLFTKNDEDYIRLYIQNVVIKSKNDLFGNEFIIYIMSSNDTIPIINEMQNFIKNRYVDYLNEIQREQSKLYADVLKLDTESLIKYCNNATITNDMIPIDIANIIIKECILGSKKINSSNVIINCLKSIANDYLNKQNVYKYAIMKKTSSLLGRDTNGVCNFISRTIIINESLIDKFLSERNIQVLVTLFHELNHALQENRINTYNDYLMQKESILLNYYKSYSDKNYLYLYSEIDARSGALSDSINYFKSINDEESCVLLEAARGNVESQFNLATIKGIPQKSYLIFASISSLFDNLIKKYPAIIRRKPIFKLEYDFSGNKKSLKQKCLDFLSLTDKEKNIQIVMIEKDIVLGCLNEQLRIIEQIISINSPLKDFILEKITNIIIDSIINNSCDQEILESFLQDHYSDPLYKPLIRKIYENLKFKLQENNNESTEKGKQI